MNASSDGSIEGQPTAPLETPPDHGFKLPAERGYRERPPKGTLEDGDQFNLMELEQVKNRREIFVQSDQRMCGEEFKL